MASVSYYDLVTVANINPGATHHWKWNNAPQNRVWSASLDVWRAKYVSSGTPRMVVTKIEYRSLYGGPTLSEREVHFWVKNTGNVNANYRLNAVSIRK